MPPTDTPIFDASGRFYVLDKNSVVVDTGGRWDTFAAANDGYGATSDQVIGQCLWDMVAGGDLRSLLNAVFFWCRREDAGFTSLYRCDSPDIARLCRMTVEPRKNGRLWIGHSDVSTATKPDLPGHVATLSSGARCAICCRYSVEGAWIDPFATRSAHLAPSAHLLCRHCRESIRAGLFGTIHAGPLLSDGPAQLPAAAVTSFP